MLKRTISVYLALAVVWVLVHFLEHTFENVSMASSDGDTRLAVLDMVIALAFLLTLVTSYQATRGHAGQSRIWFASYLFFYWAVLVAVPFFANWFASLGHTDDGFLWVFVETAGPLTWAVQAVRLWRSTATAEQLAVR